MKLIGYLLKPLNNKQYDVVVLFMRLFIGISMLIHGIPKIVNFNELIHSFPDPIGFGSTFALILTILAEVRCSILILMGLFTRLGAFVLVINMIVAFLTAGKELAVLYLAFYILILITGGGKYSLDAFITQKWIKSK